MDKVTKLSSSLDKEAVDIVKGRVKVCVLSVEDIIVRALEESSDMFGMVILSTEYTWQEVSLRCASWKVRMLKALSTDQSQHCR